MSLRGSQSRRCYSRRVIRPVLIFTFCRHLFAARRCAVGLTCRNNEQVWRKRMPTGLAPSHSCHSLAASSFSGFDMWQVDPVWVTSRQHAGNGARYRVWTHTHSKPVTLARQGEPCWWGSLTPCWQRSIRALCHIPTAGKWTESFSNVWFIISTNMIYEEGLKSNIYR